jgi:hypothetical protein
MSTDLNPPPTLQSRIPFYQDAKFNSLLEAGNEVRAVTLGFEAVLSRVSTEMASPSRGDDRQKIQEYFGQACWDLRRNPGERNFAQAFLDLRALRNAIAHCARPESLQLRTALASPERLHHELQRLFTLTEQPIPKELITAAQSKYKHSR